MSLSSQECPICFRKATLVRSQIKNYECTCDYYVHRSCYERWRTGTDRLCLICDVREVRHEVMRDDDADIEMQELLPIIQYDTDAVVHVDHDAMIDRRFRNGCCRAMCEEAVIMFSILIYGTIMLLLYLRHS